MLKSNIKSNKLYRRIQSLCHVLEKHPAVPPDTQRWHDLQLEWLRIKHAPGYGRSWINWIGSFPDIAAVPDMCPSVELLREFLQLTKFDCDAYSRQLQLNRKNVLKFRIDTDLKEGFGKMTYSWLRKPAPDVITSVQTTWKSEARLVRLTSGRVGLRLCTPTHFVVHAAAKFGDATILPLCLQKDILTFRVVQGVIPTQGRWCKTLLLVQDPNLLRLLKPIRHQYGIVMHSPSSSRISLGHRSLTWFRIHNMVYLPWMTLTCRPMPGMIQLRNSNRGSQLVLMDFTMRTSCRFPDVPLRCGLTSYVGSLMKVSPLS